MNKMKKTIFFPKKGIKLKIKIRKEEEKSHDFFLILSRDFLISIFFLIIDFF